MNESEDKIRTFERNDRKFVDVDLTVTLSQSDYDIFENFIGGDDAIDYMARKAAVALTGDAESLAKWGAVCDELNNISEILNDAYIDIYDTVYRKKLG